MLWAPTRVMSTMAWASVARDSRANSIVGGAAVRSESVVRLSKGQWGSGRASGTRVCSARRPVGEPAVRNAHHATRSQGVVEGRVVRIDAEEAFGRQGPCEGC